MANKDGGTAYYRRGSVLTREQAELQGALLCYSMWLALPYAERLTTDPAHPTENRRT